MSVSQTTGTRDVTNVAASSSLEERMPALIDDVLGRLSDVGVRNLLDLARAMVEARLAAPEAAHLTTRGVDQN